MSINSIILSANLAVVGARMSVEKHRVYERTEELQFLMAAATCDGRTRSNLGLREREKVVRVTRPHLGKLMPDNPRMSTRKFFSTRQVSGGFFIAHFLLIASGLNIPECLVHARIF